MESQKAVSGILVVGVFTLKGGGLVVCNKCNNPHHHIEPAIHRCENDFRYLGRAGLEVSDMSAHQPFTITGSQEQSEAALLAAGGGCNCVFF